MASEKNPLAVLSCAPLRILIIDDNQDFAETAVLLLTAAGHSVKCALSGHVALELAGQLRPHLVLLDLGMPGMTGYEVAKQLRQTLLGQHLVLVAVTGYGQDAERLHAAGFDRHLLKPVRIEDLASVLAMVPSPVPQKTPRKGAADEYKTPSQA